MPLMRRVTRPGPSQGQSPAVFTIGVELARIADGVLLLHVCRPAAVFKVIDALAAHVRVLDATKINPQVRELMDKKWAGEQELIVVNLPPLVSGGPDGVGFGGQGMRWRTQAEQVQEQRF